MIERVSTRLRFLAASAGTAGAFAFGPGFWRSALAAGTVVTGESATRAPRPHRGAAQDRSADRCPAARAARHAGVQVRDADGRIHVLARSVKVVRRRRR